MAGYCARERHRELLADEARLRLWKYLGGPDAEADYIKTQGTGPGGGFVELWKCKRCGKVLARALGGVPPKPPSGGMRISVDTGKVLTAVEICAQCFLTTRECRCGK